MPNPVLSRLVDERDRTSQTIDDVLEKIAKDDRDPTDSERELLTRNRERLSSLEPQIVELVDLEEQRAASLAASSSRTVPSRRPRSSGRSLDRTRRSTGRSASTRGMS